MLTLNQPALLLLLLPAAAALWLWRLPSRLFTTLRLATYLLVIAALAQPDILLRRGRATVVVVADRSASLPADAATRQNAAIRALQSTRNRHDTLGVVSFAARAAIEHAPQKAAFSGFTTEHDPDASNIAEALQTALALLKADSGARILLLSDGRYTGRDPLQSAMAATAAGVAIDYRLLARDTLSDLAVERIDAPQQLRPGEALLATAWISSPADQSISYTLRRGRSVVAQGERSISRGRSHLLFRDLPPAGSTILAYTLEINGQQPDPVPENNRARFLVAIAAAKPLLCLTASPASRLPALLGSGGVEAVACDPADFDGNLETLAGYAGLVIENTRADAIGGVSQQNIAAWVRHAGGGLLMTGGRNSFGIGGYYRSPLEAVLPVSMELRREHRKFSLAIVVALDRSGSMTATVAGGRTKMDLANLGTAEVLDLLSDQDELGVLAVDTTAHTIIPRASVATMRNQKSRILGIQSMGGGIYIYEALKAAVAQLSGTTAGVRHILLFADAADSEEPGNYKSLLASAAAAGITVSVVGLGTPADCDAALLQEIAALGGGRCFFTADALEVPRLFAQDTFMVARNTWVTNAVVPHFTVGAGELADTLPATAPPLHGYNLCYSKPEAVTAALSDDENVAPLVALGHHGSGRTAVFTGEADGAAAGPFATWGGVAEFYGALARYCAGARQTPHNGLLVLQQPTDTGLRVTLHVEPQAEVRERAEDAIVEVLRHRPGRPPQAATLPLLWQSADSLAVDLPLNGQETVLATVRYRDGATINLPPVTAPYSPEHIPDTDNNGARLLADLARATGGTALADVGEIWRLVPRARHPWPLAPYLYLLAALIFLGEIFERRTAWFAARGQRAAPKRDESASAANTPIPRGREQKLTPQATQQPSPTPEPQTSVGESPLARAKRRAAQRLQR